MSRELGLPFDPIDRAARIWERRFGPSSAMAAVTSIMRAQQLLLAELDSILRPYGLTFARYEVLTWLATDPDSARTLSWISKTLRIPPATVTDVIDRLEDDELVRREPHPSDARTTLAVITARGRRVAMAATQDLNATVYEQIGLTEPQRSQLVELLAELRANGNEFDVDRSNEVIEGMGSNAGPRRRRRQPPEVA